jgi:hypothetical protein
MSVRLDHVLNEIKDLSFEELLMLQRQIIDEVQTKAVPAAPEAATTSGKPDQTPLGFKVWNWENWPPDATYRREEIYDDDGR